MSGEERLEWRRAVIAAVLIFALIFGSGFALRRVGLATAANVAQLVSLVTIPVGLANWARGRRPATGDRGSDVFGIKPPSGLGRGVLWGSVSLACAAVAALVLREVGVVSPGARQAVDWGTATTAVIACFTLGLTWKRSRGQLMVPHGPLRTLLERQREFAQEHRYAYTVGTAPPVQQIYVDQWTEWLSPASGTGRTAPLTLAEMMRVSPNAIVLAEPGVGKSTAVAQVIWHQCTWLLDARRSMRSSDAPYGPVIPFALPADLRGCHTLPAAMAGQWEELTGIRAQAPVFGRKPPLGQAWLVIIDGIDQVLSTSERVGLLNRVGEWMSEPDPPWRVMATSRPLLSGELGWLKAEHVGRFMLRKFDEEGLREFAARWADFRKAQHLAGIEIQPITSDVFMAAIRAASLVSLARIPLIAVITALILEHDRETALPASRAALYERFVGHLFNSRRVACLGGQAPPELAAYGPPGRRAWRWLVDNLRDLLEGTADRHLTAGAPGVIACAREWAEDNAPAGLFMPVPGWDDALKGLLTATSLIVPGPAGLRWAHPNFAEYLAAGPRARKLDIESWLADARSPDSRSLALFMLARASAAENLADRLAELLVDLGGEDACIAGAIVADGIGVAEAIRHRITESLLIRLANDGVDVAAALDTLISLVGRDDVAGRLAAFAEDPAQPAWVRADVADELCGVARETGIRLLRCVLDGTGDSLLRDRILFKLAAYGELREDIDQAPAGTHAAMQGVTSAGRRAGHWYRQIAGNANAEAGQRLRALLAMAERRDPGWQSVLMDIITDLTLPDEVRRDAARRIIRLDDPASTWVIRDIASEDRLGLDVRVPLLASMVEAKDEGARVMLNRIVAHGGAEFRQRFPAIAAWTEVTGERSAEYTLPPWFPSIWGNVPARNKNFTGRTEVLDRLWQQANVARSAATEPGSAPLSPLHGLGGVGKTSIAVEYAYRHRADYDLIWWVHADHLASIRGSLFALAGRIGLTASRFSGVEDVVRAAVQALSRGEPFQRWLLIFDNADQPEEVLDFIPHGPGDVLITSRNRRWTSVAATMSIDGFTRKESIDLLLKRVPQGLEQRETDEMAERLLDLPLAIEQAGAMLAETGISAGEYLRLLDESVTGLMAEGKEFDYPVPQTAAWQLAVGTLERHLPQARELLRLMAFLGGEPIPRDLFRLGWSAASTGLSSSTSDILQDPIMLARAIRVLGRFALIWTDTRSISVHRVLQAFVREELSADEQARYRREAQLILATAAPQNPDDHRVWQRFNEILPHVAATSLELPRSQDPRVRDLALNTMRYLLNSGDFLSSREFAKRCIDQWAADSGPDDPAVLQGQQRLSAVLRILGWHDDAFRLTEQALARSQRLPGGYGSPLTLALREALAADMRIRGDFSAAASLDEGSLEILKRSGNGDSPDASLPRVMNALAVDRVLSGDYRSALELCREIQGQLKAGSQPEAPIDSPAVKITLSWVLRLCGNYDEARSAGDEALDLAREMLGSEHAITLRAARELSVTMRHVAARRDQALEMARKGRDMNAWLFGERHPDTLAATVSLANTLRMDGKLDEALTLAEEAASGYRDVYGSDHPFSLLCTGNVAVLRRLAGFPEAARGLNEAALTALEAALGRDHPYSLTIAVNLASDYAALDRTAEARALDEDTLGRLRGKLGPDHPLTLGCALNLARDLRTDHDIEAAERLAADTIALFATSDGPHPDPARRVDFDFDPPSI